MSEHLQASPSPGPLAALDEAQLKALIPEGVHYSLPRQALVICQGDYSDSLYIILRGRVKVFISDEKGKEVVLNTIGAGDYFGEFVLDGGPRTASVETLEPSKLFVVPRFAVEALLANSPEFARDLIRRLIAKVRSLSATLHDFALLDVPGRLIAFISAQAQDEGGERVLPERLTHQEVAERIGTSREVVSRTLKELVQQGVLLIKDDRRIALALRRH